jgi:hypothetical protein
MKKIQSRKLLPFSLTKSTAVNIVKCILRLSGNPCCLATVKKRRVRVRGELKKVRENQLGRREREREGEKEWLKAGRQTTRPAKQRPKGRRREREKLFSLLCSLFLPSAD